MSLRAAINAKCKACIYDPGSGNGGWREQVSACSSSNCPLHPVRPQSATKSAQQRPTSSFDGQRCLTANPKGEIAPKNGQIGRVA